MSARAHKWFSTEEAAAVITLRGQGATYRQIAEQIGRSHSAVKGFVGRNITAPRIEWPLS